MSDYLFIESRDPYGTSGAALGFDLALELARDGHRVAIFLVQNGVFAVRGKASHSLLMPLAGAGIELLADEFSLRERGIAAARVQRHVKPAPLEVVVDRLAAGSRVLWN
jgi:sulfur relay (sulfurtransferase) DsrF/TusC family protein